MSKVEIHAARLFPSARCTPAEPGGTYLTREAVSGQSGHNAGALRRRSPPTQGFSDLLGNWAKNLENVVNPHGY
jgi:hypothetical protein